MNERVVSKAPTDYVEIIEVKFIQGTFHCEKSQRKGEDDRITKHSELMEVIKCKDSDGSPYPQSVFSDPQPCEA